MYTERLQATNIPGEGIDRAGKILKTGGLVAIPTETVYGLAANALDVRAVQKIFTAKGRPQDNPLIVHIASMTALSPLVGEIPAAAHRLAQKFWPGPLTLVMKKSDQISDQVSAGLDTVAIRMPSHPVACAVIEAAGVPLAAPSANLSGSPSPTSAAHVLADLDGRIDAVLDGGDCAVGVESTIVSLAEKTPRLLRPGGITAEQLRAVVGPMEFDPAVLGEMNAGPASAPGMKYQHYAPRAQVTMVRSNAEQYARYVNAHAGEGVFALCFEQDRPGLAVPSVSYGHVGNDASQARALFGALRALDASGARVVYARCPELAGVGMAVYNRLLRAAAFRVVEL